MKFCAKVVKNERNAKSILFFRPTYTNFAEKNKKIEKTMTTLDTRWKQFFAEMRSTYKSMDTEETWDIWVVRPIGFVEACLCRKLRIHPNVVTIISILFGVASGYFFIPGHKAMVLLGTLLLFFANTLDSADGQLARMTKQYTLFGRALDGLAGEFWFTSIYLGILIRMYTLTIPFTEMHWAWIGVLFTIFSSLVCHSRQAALADYYRVLHLHFLNRHGYSELARSATLLAEASDTTAPRLERWWKKLFSGYTRNQERMTPHLQRLLQAIEQKGEEALPEVFYEEYRAHSLPLMPCANILSFNTRFFALVISMFLGMPWLYLLFECIVLSALAFYMHRRHEKFSARLYQKYFA